MLKECGRLSEKSIRMTIKSRLENVFLIGLAVNRIVSYSAGGEVDASLIELCVVEAVNNAIEHAYGYNTDKDVEVVVNLYKNGVSFDINDWGAPLNPDLPLKDFKFEEKDIPLMKENGRGLKIINKTMDYMAFNSCGGKNTLSMCKMFKSG